ncbi:MAG: anaerobic ribonucleoside-triphosphate reductase activating protein [Candidatus Adiutrix sp.]|nr:anaerobic ribonucleoside-triphosphate reductase activating protein [Candidatus Adiutrix sp.]
MRLGGLVKSTALDFPGLMSAAVFTQGCNFTCPYCHNPHLVRLFGEPLPEDDVLLFLRRRRPLLDGVIITGGEPTLQPDLAEFCKKLQGLGYAVKLDTNGSAPGLIADLIERRLINYLALDIKDDPRHYPPEIAPHDPGEAIVETINILKRTALPHEFRTTAVSPFVTAGSMAAISQAAAGPAQLFIQVCRPGDYLNPDFMAAQPPLTRPELEEFCALASHYLPTRIR